MEDRARVAGDLVEAGTARVASASAAAVAQVVAMAVWAVPLVC